AKIEIESEPPTKLPDGQSIERFLLSPDSKYAVTHSSNYDEIVSNSEHLICGWQLDQEQTENESSELVAVSNNKLVAIAIVAGYELRIIVLNLAIKKKINQDFPYPVDIPVFRAEFYNNEDFVMPQIINNYCLILKGTFKNLHNDKQSWTSNNSIFCGKIRDVEDHTINKEKILLLDKCGSLTQWNLNTLSIEKTYQLDIITNYNRVFYIKYNFNKNSTLLAVYSRLLKGATFMSGIIYVYSVENSMLLSR
ncbi:21627_t:CDS:2, partial [Gigaspora rosea]